MKRTTLIIEDVTVGEMVNTLEGDLLHAFLLFLRDIDEFVPVYNDRAVVTLYRSLVNCLDEPHNRIEKIGLARMIVESLGWLIKFTDEYSRR